MTTLKLIKNKDGKSEWVEVDRRPSFSSEQKKMNAQGEDLTVDGYISKHGGIESNIDGKVYTTKNSYMDHIKANGCTIKDW